MVIGGEFQNMLLCTEQDAAWQPRTTDQIEPSARWSVGDDHRACSAGVRPDHRFGAKRVCA